MTQKPLSSVKNKSRREENHYQRRPNQEWQKKIKNCRQKRDYKYIKKVLKIHSKMTKIKSTFVAPANLNMIKHFFHLWLKSPEAKKRICSFQNKHDWWLSSLICSSTPLSPRTPGISFKIVFLSSPHHFSCETSCAGIRDTRVFSILVPFMIIGITEEQWSGL